MKAFFALAAILSLTLLPQLPGKAGNRNGPGDASESRPEFKTSASAEIPTVDYCEMVKNPRPYFDKTVRVAATLELAIEAVYLTDDKCPLSHDDQIGVRFVSASEAHQKLLNAEVYKVRSIEYGGRAKVTVVGTLRNSALRSFAWYRYRFDISGFEKVNHVIVPYKGEMQGGNTYRALVRGDKRLGLVLVNPMRMPNVEFVVKVEWTNLSEFPSLEQLRQSSREQQIVFSVVGDKYKQLTERRWDRIISCKIISVE